LPKEEKKRKKKMGITFEEKERRGKNENPMSLCDPEKRKKGEKSNDL